MAGRNSGPAPGRQRERITFAKIGDCVIAKADVHSANGIIDGAKFKTVHATATAQDLITEIGKKRVIACAALQRVGVLKGIEMIIALATQNQIVTGISVQRVIAAETFQRVVARAAGQNVIYTGQADDMVVRDDAADGAVEHQAAGDLAVKGQVPLGHDVVLQGQRAFVRRARAEGQHRVGGGVADRKSHGGAAKADHLQHVALGEIRHHIGAEALVVGAVPDQLGAEAVIACAARHLVVVRAIAAAQLVIPVTAIQRVISPGAVQRIGKQ